MKTGELLWTMVWPLVLYDGITAFVGVLWPGGDVLAIQAAAAFLAAAVLGIVFFQYKRSHRIWAGGKQKDGDDSWKLWLTCILLGVTGCLFFNNMMEVSGLKNLFPGYQKTSQELFAPSLAFQILAMGVLVPVTEELVFRGFIYGALRKARSFAVAAAVSAVLFGLYHGSIVQGLYAGGLAVVLACSYEFSGRLLVPVAVHGISNLTAVVAERYHLYDKNWSEIPFFLLTAVCGAAMVCLLGRMRKANLKEDN